MENNQYNKFIESKPEDLEKVLKQYEGFEGVVSNLGIDELCQNVSGYVEKKTMMLIADGKDVSRKSLQDVYFFFRKNKGDNIIQLIPHVGLCLSLNPSKYDFEDRTIQINPKKVEGLVLSEETTKMYEKILNSNSINPNELFEKVGYIINNSMEYDFNKIISLEEKCHGLTDFAKKQWEDKRKLYKTTGFEVTKGICSDAGKQIRKILFNMGINNRYGITHVSSSNGETLHDTTLVFDKQKGNWGVINSKSPTKNFNLATKKQLWELGSPYLI